jgi:antitoxin component of MazEF toxin-antitoxin module
MRVKVRQFEDQLGVVLPDELIASLGWESGDILEVEVENKGLKIVRVETSLGRGMRIAKRAMENYRGALEELAKT